MGLRFRRSWGVLPGVRLNLGLKSGSMSFGVRGLHYTVGTKGSRVTAGLPGTGLYWTHQLNSPKTPRSTQATGYVPPVGAVGLQSRVAQRPLNQAAKATTTQSFRAPQVALLLSQHCSRHRWSSLPVNWHPRRIATCLYQLGSRGARLRSL